MRYIAPRTSINGAPLLPRMNMTPVSYFQMCVRPGERSFLDYIRLVGNRGYIENCTRDFLCSSERFITRSSSSLTLFGAAIKSLNRSSYCRRYVKLEVLDKFELKEINVKYAGNAGL